jgi:Tol biopolymer transport system component
MTDEKDDDPFLEELARAILDGAPAPGRDRGVEDDARAAVIREAEVLARIASVHQHAHRDLAPPNSNTAGPVSSWGRLTILGELGRGAFGAVYRARDPHLDREVALKLLWPDGSDPDRFLTSMLEEGRLLARIHHPNIVTIYDANVIDGRVGLTMELVRGQTLAQEFETRGRFPAADAGIVGREIARALAAVHDAGLLHRDVKAQNIMRRSDGRLVLMDFGAGRQADGEGGDNEAITGTPLYLAPEVLGRQRATVQSDVYSLGVLLFYLLTGSYPVSGRTIRELRDAHRTAHRARLRALRPDVPEELAAVVDRALAASPSERWTTAAAMADALDARHGRGPSIRKWRVTALVLASLAAAVVALFIALRRPPADDALTIRKMSMPADFLSGVISYDGRYLAYSAGEGDRLMLHDFGAGTDRELGDREQNGGGIIESAVLSHDHRRVAFSWESDAARELRIAGATAPGRASVLMHDETPGGSTMGAVLMPVDWTPDDSALLVLRSRGDGTHDIVLVQATDGRVHTLKQGFESLVSLRLSNDGRYVVFDRPNADDEDARDISVMAIQSGEEVQIARDPAQDAMPIWMPGDAGVVFTSDRSGTFGLWWVPVANGRATGPPRIIRKDIGRIGSMRLTSDGSLFYALQSGAVDVYRAGLGVDGTVVSGSAVPAAASYLGSNLDPEWSPDGAALAYVSRRRTLGPRRHALVIRTPADGPERTLWPDLDGFVEPRWSPDGRRLLVRGADRQGRSGAWLLDAASGTVVRRVQPLLGWDMEWLADSRSVVSMRDNVVARFDVDTGAVQELYRDSGGRTVSSVAITRDGRELAISVDDARTRTLLVLPATGGGARSLMTADAPDGFVLQDYTPDGKNILVSRYTSTRPPAVEEWALWRIPIDGGAPRSMNLSGHDLRGVKVSPDGARIAYRTGEPAWDYWLMRNVLP